MDIVYSYFYQYIKAKNSFCSSINITHKVKNPIFSIFSRLTDNLSEGIIYQNHKGEIVYANPSAAAIFQLTPEKLLNKPFPVRSIQAVKADLSPFPDSEYPAMLALQTGTTQKDVIMGVFTGKNDLTWLKINAHPLFNEEGKTESVVTSFVDITPEIETSKRLSIIGQNQHAILSSINDGFYLIDNQYQIVLINNAAIDIHQFVFGKIFKEHDCILDIFTENRKAVVKHFFDKAFTGEKSQYEVLYNQQTDPVWLSVSYTPVINNSGDINHVCIGIRNITARKKAEEELMESERKFRAIFNSTFQFMGLMTVDGILIEANQTATDFFRIPKDEVMGMNFVDSRWFSESTREKSKKALAKAAQGETVNYELELELLDGRNVVIDFSIRPIFDANGKVILLIPEGRDITEKLKMQHEIELARESKQKDILQAGIEGQEKQRREVARELHDNINQVLATVKVYLQLAEENENMREALIQKSHENISHAIEEVRKLSRSLAPPSLEDTTLTEALAQMVNDMVLSMRFTIKFDHENFDETLLTASQKIAIYRIVQEQFTNILKYSRSQNVWLSVSSDNKNVTIDIKDDGVGFDTKERLKGTGIKNIINRVEAQNGLFELHSSPGSGCSITAVFPLQNNFTDEIY